MDRVTRIEGGLHCDAPVRVSNDRLERAEAARRLVREMYVALSDSASVALGLEAEWGWGKTSFLNFMVEGVKKLNAELSCRERWTPPRPVVVEFNPWYCSGRNDLYLRFLKSISRQARRYIGRREEGKRWARALNTVAETFLGSKARPLSSFLQRSIEQPTATDKRLGVLRDIAVTELGNANHQLWVFIDDLDRLGPGEIVHFLALIRAMEPLPWIRYLIAYDKSQMQRMIRQAIYPGSISAAFSPADDHVGCQGQEELGVEEEYFQKFIQIEIVLKQLKALHRQSRQARRGKLPDSEDVRIGSRLKRRRDRSETNSYDLVAFAVRVCASERFLGPCGLVAWIGTLAAMLSEGFPVIDTPRAYRRYYNQRYVLDRINGDEMLHEVRMLIAGVRSYPECESMITRGGGSKHVADAIGMAMRNVGWPHRLALEHSLRFLGAWAEKARPTSSADDYQKIERDDVSERRKTERDDSGDFINE